MEVAGEGRSTIWAESSGSGWRGGSKRARGAAPPPTSSRARPSFPRGCCPASSTSSAPSSASSPPPSSAMRPTFRTPQSPPLLPSPLHFILPVPLAAPAPAPRGAGLTAGVRRRTNLLVDSGAPATDLMKKASSPLRSPCPSLYPTHPQVSKTASLPPEVWNAMRVKARRDVVEGKG